MAKEQWQREKINVVKDKEILEERVNELDSTVERMTRDIESLTSSLKEKQNIISLQEAEKERIKQQERNNRKEFSEQIELLTRRAQQYLKQLEDKTSLCDRQQQLLSTLEMKEEQLIQDNKKLHGDVVKMEEAQREQQKEFKEDLQYLFIHYVLDHEEDKEESGSPDWEQVIKTSANDPHLTSLLQKWRHLLLPESSQYNA